MKLEIESRKLCNTLKHFLKCPTCQSKIILDQSVLDTYSDKIYCYYCSKDFVIIKIVRTKNKLELEIEYEKDK